MDTAQSQVQIQEPYMPSWEMKKIKNLSEVKNVKFFNATIHK